MWNEERGGSCTYMLPPEKSRRRIQKCDSECVRAVSWSRYRAAPDLGSDPLPMNGLSGLRASASFTPMHRGYHFSAEKCFCVHRIVFKYCVNFFLFYFYRYPMYADAILYSHVRDGGGKKFRSAVYGWRQVSTLYRRAPQYFSLKNSRVLAMCVL